MTHFENKEALRARIELVSGKGEIKRTGQLVTVVLDILREGGTAKTVTETYPWLEESDVAACQLFAQEHPDQL